MVVAQAVEKIVQLGHAQPSRFRQTILGGLDVGANSIKQRAVLSMMSRGQVSLFELLHALRDPPLVLSRFAAHDHCPQGDDRADDRNEEAEGFVFGQADDENCAPNLLLLLWHRAGKACITHSSHRDLSVRPRALTI